MKILRNVQFETKWWYDEYGIESKNPFEESMDEQIEKKMKKSKLLYERYGYLGIGDPDPKPVYSIPQYDGRIVVSGFFGGKRPGWEKKSGCYWIDRTRGALGDIGSVSDIVKIKIPNWDDSPLVNETFERFEQDKSSRYYKEGKVDSPWTYETFFDPRTGAEYKMIGFMCVVDLAPFLYGDTEFFTAMIEDEDFTFALLDKCYEISTDYTSYMAKRFGINTSDMGWSTMGGDYSCVLSPELYEKYIKPYDLQRMGENNLNCINLHSCGASSHLYGVWGKYPHRESILVMQTRGIEGKLAHLRECLPYTLIQLTMHQPQCDFENIPAQAVEKMIRAYAEEAGYDNLEVNAIVVQKGSNTDRNIEAFCKTVDEINENIS